MAKFSEFIQTTKRGEFDVNISLYDANLFCFFEWSMTCNKRYYSSIKALINHAIQAYKEESGYDKRKDTDENKYEPCYCSIFTSPSFQSKVFKPNGREVKDIDSSKLDRCEIYWVS